MASKLPTPDPDRLRLIVFGLFCLAVLLAAVGLSDLAFQHSVLASALQDPTKGYAHIRGKSQFMAFAFPIFLLTLGLNLQGLNAQQGQESKSTGVLRLTTIIVPYALVTIWTMTNQMQWLANWAAHSSMQNPVMCSATVHGRGKGRWTSYLYARDASLCNRAMQDPQAPRAY